MPTSRSPNRNTKAPLPPRQSRFLLPLILIIVLAVLIVVVVVLPASLVRRVLPPAIQADDFSGTVWHGSAGKVIVNARDGGAVEWRVHPGALLTLMLSADVHWVLGGFVADASVAVDRRSLDARDIRGGGPIEDLKGIGMVAGWHGEASFKFSELKLRLGDDPPTLLSAVGDLDVADLSSPQVADGADLGGYSLTLGRGAVTADGATARLTDTSGPLQIEAEIRFSAKDQTGLLTGTIKERAGAPPALLAQLDQLAQLHARDAQGRLPVDLEFTL